MFLRDPWFPLVERAVLVLECLQDKAGSACAIPAGVAIGQRQVYIV